MASGGLAVVLPASDVSADDVQRIAEVMDGTARYCIVVWNENDPTQNLLSRTSFPRGLRIESLALPFQVGKLATVRAGIAYCLRHWECDAIAQVDGHLKQPPSIVGRLYDLVIAGEANLALRSLFASGARRRRPSPQYLIVAKRTYRKYLRC